MLESGGSIRRACAAGNDPAELVPAAWEALAATRFVAR
jgi:hypothetical protein